MIPLVPPAVAALTGSVAYYSPYIWRLACVSALRKRVTERRLIVLTYDDGPSRSTTPAILHLLRDHDAKATFFMLGRSARQHATIADRVVEEGHEVGCHSNEHLNSWKVNPWTAIDDINSGYTTLRPWVRPDGIYRPPYGKMTLPIFCAIRKRRARVGWWTIDSGDARERLPSPKQVADRVLREGGGVILMHDLDRSSERDAFVVETTALLLIVAAHEAFNVVQLSSVWS